MTQVHTIEIDDARNEDAADLVGYETTAREIAHHLDTLTLGGDNLMRKDLLDGFCMLLSRMRSRRETSLERLARKLDQTPDVGDEISGNQRDELQDKIATVGLQLKALEDALKGAAFAYEELTGDHWVPASATPRTSHGSLALATEIALGNVKPSCPEHQAFRVLVTGDATSTDPALIKSYLDRLAAKQGAHRLWIYTGDAPRGVDATVVEWCRHARVTVRQYGLQHERHGKRAGFVRNKTMISQEPHAAIVFGGSGVQADLVDIALQNGIKVYTPVAPTGWTVDETLRPVRPSSRT